jgi:hypothetical protein
VLVAPSDSTTSQPRAQKYDKNAVLRLAAGITTNWR